jgi:uncharacterized protein YijF (DUF1287 family)
MQRRTFLGGVVASAGVAIARDAAAWAPSRESGAKLAQAAKRQLGVTTGYDPRYVRMAYPGGDVPRVTGVCADVVVRAGRDGLGLDLQRLVHEDMARDFAAYPKTWGMRGPDSNIDHRRVLNLAVFWKRTGAALWTGNAWGDGFGGEMEEGDLLTWLLDGRLPHVGVVVSTGLFGARVVHNIGSGVQENALVGFREHRATGHFRWPVG